MKKRGSTRFAQWAILHSSFFLLHFPALAKGEIASLAGAADDPRYFQISLPVQPGNSGGALVDARGNVVGIVAAKLDAAAALVATGSLPENVNFAGRAACS